MKKIIYLSVLMAVLIAQPLSANPPSSITLTYDKEKKILLVEVNHVSYDIREHYIRRLYVTKNDEEPKTFWYTSQKTPSGFSREVPLEAKKGDVIHVKVLCSEAGSKEETLTVE